MSYINRDKLIQFLSAWKQSEGDTELSAEFIADHVLEKISWKPMSTAPKNRPIAVYNIPFADEFGFTDEPDGTVVVVWVPDDEGWMIHGSEFNTDGSYPRISNPRAWMETPVYVI